MNILQAFKMAWKSIAGKKGRSALTILSIFIGHRRRHDHRFGHGGHEGGDDEAAQRDGSNRLTVYMYSWMYDADGNNISHDYFPDLYDYCQSMKETVVGVTPNGQANATVVYGTKNSANMETKYDEQWNLISGPPTIFFGSDQYSACSNLTLARDVTLRISICRTTIRLASSARRRRRSSSARSIRSEKRSRSTVTSSPWSAFTPRAAKKGRTASTRWITSLSSPIP